MSPLGPRTYGTIPPPVYAKTGIQFLNLSISNSAIIGVFKAHGLRFGLVNYKPRLRKPNVAGVIPRHNVSTGTLNPHTPRRAMESEQM